VQRNLGVAHGPHPGGAMQFAYGAQPLFLAMCVPVELQSYPRFHCAAPQ